MQLQTVRKGKYVVAVSGGVDSMVLLDLLAQQSKLELVVAHFDHGIREDSSEDRKLVSAAARRYNLPFSYKTAQLGPGTSEAEARDARYAFLRDVQHKFGARAIITAHHRDDMLETAILNLLRGTGRKGLSSLASTRNIVRPMLEWSKKDIRTYAETHDIAWREDSTNADDRYLRNYIRRHILARFTPEGKDKLYRRIKKAGKLNKAIDGMLEQDLGTQPSPTTISRAWYLQLPYAVATEMMATWLRRNGIGHFDRTLIEHLVVAAKTARPGKQADVDARHTLEFSKDNIRLAARSRR